MVIIHCMLFYLFDELVLLPSAIYSRLDFSLPPGVGLYFGITRKNYSAGRPSPCASSGSACFDVLNGRCMRDGEYTSDDTFTMVTSPVYMHVSITRSVKVTWCCGQPMSRLTSIHYVLCYDPVQGVAAMVSHFFSFLLYWFSNQVSLKDYEHNTPAPFSLKLLDYPFPIDMSPGFRRQPLIPKVFLFLQLLPI